MRITGLAGFFLVVLSATVFVAAGPPEGFKKGPGHHGPRGSMGPPAVIKALDANHDGNISQEEINNAVKALNNLDKNKDGNLTPNEFAHPRIGPRGAERKGPSGHKGKCGPGGQCAVKQRPPGDNQRDYKHHKRGHRKHGRSRDGRHRAGRHGRHGHSRCGKGKGRGCQQCVQRRSHSEHHRKGCPHCSHHFGGTHHPGHHGPRGFGHYGHGNRGHHHPRHGAGPGKPGFHGPRGHHGPPRAHHRPGFGKPGGHHRSPKGHQGPPRGHHGPGKLIEHFKQVDKNDDKKISKEEASEHFTKAFNKVDANGDGQVEGTEIRKFVETMHKIHSKDPGDPPQGMKPGAPHRPGFGKPGGHHGPAQGHHGPPKGDHSPEKMIEHLKQLDKDGDNKISKEEAPGRMKENFDKLDSNSDGTVDAEEIRKMMEHFRSKGHPGHGKGPADKSAHGPKGQHGPPRGHHGPAHGPPKGRHFGPPGGPHGLEKMKEHFKKVDKDGNGKISKEEAINRLSQGFDKVDANGDGQVEETEIRKFVETMFKSRLQGKGGPPHGKKPEGASKPNGPLKKQPVKPNAVKKPAPKEKPVAKEKPAAAKKPVVEKKPAEKK